MTPSYTANGLAQGTLVNPKALMSIRNLELRARVVVEGFWNGIHRSPYHGFSVEFTEYRPYTAGDDTRQLDWRVFARSDRFFIKRFEEETNLRCYLLVDGSRSMAYGSQGITKAEYASTLAATLAYFLHLQGDAVGLVTFGERIHEYLPARHRIGHLRQLMFSLEKPPAGTTTDLTLPFKRVLESVRKRALVIAISDFFAPIERLEADLIALGASGHEVVVFQVLDPAEISFGFELPAMFEDMESGRSFYVDPIAARQQYLQQFAEHGARLKGICQRLGIVCHSLATGQALELALFDFLRGRMARRVISRRVSVARSNTGGAASS